MRSVRPSFSTVRDLKRLAKRVQKERGITLSAAQDLVAKEAGYRNLHAALKALREPVGRRPSQPERRVATARRDPEPLASARDGRDARGDAAVPGSGRTEIMRSFVPDEVRALVDGGVESEPRTPTDALLRSVDARKLAFALNPNPIVAIIFADEAAREKVGAGRVVSWLGRLAEGENANAFRVLREIEEASIERAESASDGYSEHEEAIDICDARGVRFEFGWSCSCIKVENEHCYSPEHDETFPGTYLLNGKGFPCRSCPRCSRTLETWEKRQQTDRDSESSVPAVEVPAGLVVESAPGDARFSGAEFEGKGGAQ